MSRTHRQDEKRITVRSVGRRALSCVMALAMAVSLGMGQPAVYAAEEMDTAVDTASQGLCVHHPEHTAECGYTEGVEGQPCNHVHDESCGYVEAQPEVPCDKGCTDTDGDGVIDHTPDCAYRPAVEGQPCNHVHDESCGYVEAQPGTPCIYAENGCPYCITDWSWVDPEEMLVEMDGSWGMGMPGVSADTPLTRDELSTMLPTQINATADNGDTQTLDITWDLTAIPEEGATGGDYTITASLADDTYALTEDAAPLTVTLQLGASTDTDKTETDTDTTEDTEEPAADTSSENGAALYTELPSGEPPLSDHIINNVSPHGTTIDLFDYWITSQTDADFNNYQDPDNFSNRGINTNHALLFRTGTSSNGYGDWNKWTGTEKPEQNIVQSELQEGYPQLNVNVSSTVYLRGRDGQESLAYLFDPNIEHEGKKSYPDVKGLLQVDNDGYYYYNSQENYAVYYPDNNAFTVYDLPGVASSYNASDLGQFFPFNEALSQVGWLGNKQVVNNSYAASNSVNHYFGVHMSTRFVQQYGGHVDSSWNAKAVTYEFSGDDDVWIFIDGKLVGDLGGIHNASSISINFATGKILINDTNGNGQQDWGESHFQVTTLKEMMGLSSATLPDNTYHTLDFFYLERGNSASNMNLKYNLVTIPESSVIKVDQLGNAVQGAKFKLYDADEYERLGENASAIAVGTTDADGEFIFQKNEANDNRPITIQELYDQCGDNVNDEKADLVLVETQTPSGYRSVGEIGLYFYKPDNGADEVLLLADKDSIWQKGAYAMPKVTATAPETIHLLQTQGGATPPEDVNLSGNNAVENPLMFAVVFQKQANDTWLPISGDPINGWVVQSGSNWDNILAAAVDNPYVFQLASSGAYQVEISNLPGDIRTYYHICKNLDAAKYTIAYYYTTAKTLGEASQSNTWRIDSDKEVSTSESLSRVFSMDVYVSNVKNYLMVQKVDDQGSPVNGAEFALYNASDIETDPQTKELSVKDGASPIKTVETSSENNGTITLSGGAVFNNLSKGEYYVQEITAPGGYKINSTLTHVIVDDTGVYADAGSPDDDVSVLRGVGSVLRSMVQFAAKDNVDVTLHDIKATMVSGSYTKDINNSIQWNWDKGNWSTGVTHLSFINGHEILDYGPESQNDSLMFKVDSGWSKLLVQQCDVHKATDGKPSVAWNDLKDQDITNLFSGTVVVQVTNDRTGNLKISKTVEGENAPDQEFTFAVTVTKDGTQISDTYDTVDKNSQEGSITFTSGTATVTLKGKEEITILGLPTGATFTVEETNMPNGFTPDVVCAESGGGTATKDSANSAKATGTIGHDTSDASATTLAYTNTYDGSVSVTLNGTKTLQGRYIMNSDNFTFKLEAGDEATTAAIRNEDVDLPATTEVTVNGDGNSDTSDFAFDAIKFKTEGIYTFKITEKLPDGVTAGNPVSGGIRYDTHTSTVTVTVQKDVTGLLEVGAVTYSDGKKATFTNIQESLTITKTVTGKLGDRDKGFTFKITLKDASDNDLTGSYSYTGGVLNNVQGVTPPTSATMKSGDTITLKHGQTITIQGLPAGTKYTIQETNAAADGYTTKINDVTSSDYTATGTVQDNATQVVNFVNERDGTVPTGIMIDSFPWMMAAGLCLLCGAALLLTWKIRRRNQMNHFHED